MHTTHTLIGIVQYVCGAPLCMKTNQTNFPFVVTLRIVLDTTFPLMLLYCHRCVHVLVSLSLFVVWLFYILYCLTTTVQNLRRRRRRHHPYTAIKYRWWIIFHAANCQLINIRTYALYTHSDTAEQAVDWQASLVPLWQLKWILFRAKWLAKAHFGHDTQ